MTDTKPPEAQPKKALIYKYLHIPEGEYFNPDRPSLEAACGGNRTQGSVLGYLASKACYIAEKSKLEGRVVRITVERADILRALRISEKTYICCLKALNGYKYTDAKRYARSEIDIDLDAIDKGIANPPAQKLRGRPRGTRKCAKVEGIKGTENTSTLSEIPSTYVQELEMKVEALSEKLKVLQDKVESITTFEKELQLFRKVLQLSLSSERTSQEALAAFSQRLEVLESNERGNERGNSVSAFASTPAPASLDSASHSLPSQWLSEEGEIAIDENDTHSQLSTPDVENLFDAVDNLDPDATIGRMPAIPKGHDDASGTLDTGGLRGIQPDYPTSGVRVGAATGTQNGQEGVSYAQPATQPLATATADPAIRDALSTGSLRSVDSHEIDTLSAQHGKDAEHMAAPSPTDAATPAASLVPPAPGKGKGKGRGKPEKPPEPTLEESMTPDELLFYHEWCSLFRVPVPLTAAIAKSAKALACPLATWADILKVERAEVLKQFRGWEFQCNNSNGYFTKRGVKLYDLERDLEGWQSAMQQQIDGPSDMPMPAPVVGRQTFYDKLPEPDAEWLANYYSRQNGARVQC